MRKTIKAFSKIYAANKQLILYLFFGVCTTVINTSSYWLLYDVLVVNNIVSSIFAWIAAVIFAFFTNKLFVFESKQAGTTACISEVISFFGCRLLTGILDVVIMAVTVDILQWNGLLWKLISNIIVTIINYVTSKLFIFKK